jgi:Family of unknown function (DUF6527)
VSVLRLNLRAIVESRSNVDVHLEKPGDAVLVRRGRNRWLIVACPCGCGDALPLNLDPKAGPAWRLYESASAGVSLYPSVWRDTGCGSHFILWRDEIYLFGSYDDEEEYGTASVSVATHELQDEVFALMRHDRFISYVDIADDLRRVPWEVLGACRALAKQGAAVEGEGKERGRFRLVSLRNSAAQPRTIS